MGQEVLVQVFVPIVNQKFDVYIPKNLRVHQTTELLVTLFKKKLENSFIEKNIFLCDKSSGKILDVNITNEEANIVSGTELMLI